MKPPTPTPFLQMRGIRKTFPGVVALDGVDLNLDRGEVHVVLGENGAGKSTLMKILSGVYAMEAGEIRIEGTLVSIRSPNEARELGISAIYQEPALVPQLTVAENIFLGREPVRFCGIIDGRGLVARARGLLDELGIAVDARIPVGRLSMAGRQMVEVARALSVEARILIMDEPTSALTVTEIERLFAAIKRLKDKGVGILYISHRLGEIQQIGDRVTILRDGKRVSTQGVAEVMLPELVRLMADRELGEHFPKKLAPLGEELLRVSGLNRGAKLRNVSLALRAGEVLGIFGLVGAGRTELARALFGADPIDSGEIRIRGERVQIRSPADAIQRGMGLLSEDRRKDGLILTLSLKENVTLTTVAWISRFGILDEAREKALAERFVDRLRIKASGLRQPIAELSGGNQQKVIVAKWLAREADILLFDEPTRGIDVGAKVEIYRLMNELTAGGAGIVMISSELPEITGMSDRVLVMREGAIVAGFSRKDAGPEKILAAALGHGAGSS